LTLQVCCAEDFYDKMEDLINSNVEQLGYMLPLSRERINELFSPSTSYVLLEDDSVVAAFNYISGHEKTSPTVFLRFVVQSPHYVKEIIKNVLRITMAQEKLWIRVSRFGYDRETIKALIDVGFKVGAEIPEMASYGGELYSQYILYYDIKPKYKFKVEREYKNEELYPMLSLEKVRKTSFRVRGLRFSDLEYYETIFNQPNVFRTMGGGVFEGLIYVDKDRIINAAKKREYYTIVCVDQVIDKPVGFLSLGSFPQDVLKGVGNIGMFVDERYQGIGVGSTLLENAILLAKRLHYRLLFLSVFDTNIAGVKLYEKFGFKEHGRVPGWFQNGYVKEIMMTRRV